MGLRKELLPALDPKTANEECKVTSRNAHCFAAGDFRYKLNRNCYEFRLICIIFLQVQRAARISINSYNVVEGAQQDSQRLVYCQSALG